MSFVVYHFQKGLFTGLEAGNDQFTHEAVSEIERCVAFETASAAEEVADRLGFELRDGPYEVAEVPGAGCSADRPQLERAGMGWPACRMKLPTGMRHGWIVGCLQIEGMDGGFLTWEAAGAVARWTAEGELVWRVAEAHTGIVLGLRQTSIGFVSWSADMSVFWSMSGAQLSTSAVDDGPFAVVAAGPDAIARCTADGRVRFWSLDGEAKGWSRVDAGPKTARSLVSGIYGFALLDDDGRVHTWRPDGVATGVLSATAGRSYEGVMATEEGYRAWETGGAFCNFDLTDARVQRGTVEQESEVGGVRQFKQSFALWDREGGLRFFREDGRKELGGGRFSPEEVVLGVEEIESGYVSWGSTGIVRFWDCNGTCRPWDSRQPHAGMILGAAEFGTWVSGWFMASWDTSGVIVFWDSDHSIMMIANRDECPEQFHSGQVKGVHATETGFVSWDSEGSVYFWTPEGERLINTAFEDDDAILDYPPGPLPCGHRAHETGVADVVVGARVIASVGQDGVLRFWAHDGTPIGTYTGLEDARQQREAVV